MRFDDAVGSVPSADVFVVDLRHFLDLPGDVPGPARRMAEYVTGIVRAGSAGPAGQPWVAALGCCRRPARQRCPGPLIVLRVEVPARIEWRCASCGDDGVISDWEGSPFDLRDPGRPAGAGSEVAVFVSPATAAGLRDVVFLDVAAERIVWAGEAGPDGVRLVGDPDDFEDLLDSVAADANHAEDRPRRRRLDDAFDALRAALATAGR